MAESIKNLLNFIVIQNGDADQQFVYKWTHENPSLWKKSYLSSSKNEKLEGV